MFDTIHPPFYYTTIDLYIFLFDYTIPHSFEISTLNTSHEK